jgi:La-related protein 7
MYKYVAFNFTLQTPSIMPTPVDEEESEVPVIPEPEPSSSFLEDMESNAADEGGEGGSSEKKNSKHRQRVRKQKLYASIRKQMEFYFSDANITKQRMMKEIVLENDYVNLQLFVEKFNKVSQLSKNIDDFRRALKQSEKLELSEDELGVRRKVPFEEAKVKTDEAVENCTIYVENISPEVNHEWIEKTFQEFGSVAYISLPKFKRSGQPKGFAFVEFEEEDAAKRCLEAYGEIGACLPSNIDPAELMSVTTYNEEMKPQAKKGKMRAKVKDKNLKRTRAQTRRSEEDDGIVAKKLKIVKADATTGSFKIETEPDSKDDEECFENISESGKKKVESKQENMEAITSEKSNVIAEPDQEGDESASAVAGTEAEAKVSAPDTPGKKKKRKRNKKKKADDVSQEKLEIESELIHLRILPKKHWRQLRNRYLNLQRVNMSKLKAQLRTEENRRYLEPNPPPQPPTTNKSICIKICLSSQAESVETFKSQINELVPLDWSNLVKHVDYEDGKLEAIVRMDGNPACQPALSTFVENAGRVFKSVVTMTSKFLASILFLAQNPSQSHVSKFL